MKKIELTEDDVEVTINSTTKRNVSLPRLIDALRPTTDLIPINLRWAHPATGTYVMEFPPQRRLIEVQGRVSKPGMYSIPVPWQIYVYNYNMHQLRFFCRTEQLRNLNDTLYHQYMSNIYRSGEACKGTRGKRNADPLTSMRNAIDAMWMTSFNGGYYLSSGHPGFEMELHDDTQNEPLMPKEMRDFDEFWPTEDFFGWLEERSIQELLDWTWEPAGTLDEFIPTEANNPEVWEGLRQLVTQIN